jgi:hypothetical protein
MVARRRRRRSSAPGLEDDFHNYAANPPLRAQIRESHLVRVHQGTVRGDQDAFIPPRPEEPGGIRILVPAGHVLAEIDPGDVVRTGLVEAIAVVGKDHVVRWRCHRGQVADPGRVVEQPLEGGDRHHAPCIDESEDHREG